MASLAHPPRKVLILGASSAIAQATAAVFAARGETLYLAARDSDELERISADLALRYDVTIHHGSFDVVDLGQHEIFINAAIAAMGGLDGVIVAVGLLGDQQQAQSDFRLVEKTVMANFTGPMSLIDHCARYLEAQKSGFIVGISSVAGDRGRQSNYYYGAAKGGFSRYLEGLRNRLSVVGVDVLTVKPGFVDTAMTYGMPGLFLVASPQSVGRAIVRAVDKRRHTLYVPWFWRYIMLIIRHIPEFIFRRLKL